MDSKTKLLLVSLYGAAFVASFSEALMNVPLTAISVEFSVDSVTAQWLITGYMIVGANLMALAAFFLRQFGLRKVFLLSTVLFLLSGALAIFAPNFAILLVLRLVQACGTGVLIALMTSSIFIVVPEGKRATYMAVAGAIITMGPAMGPVISGAMVSYFGWRAVFVPPCIFIVLFILTGSKSVRDLTPIQKASLDVPSLVLSVVGLVGVMYGLTQVMINVVHAVVSLVLGLLVLAVFARRQLKIENPLLHTEPLRNKAFTICSCLTAIGMLATFSMSVLTPIYYQTALELSAFASGALCMIPVFANAIISIPAGKLMDKRGEWPLFPCGFALALLGCVGAAVLAPKMMLIPVVIASVLISMGIGMTFMPSQTSGLSKLTPEINADGVAIVNVLVQVAACIGSSLYIGVLQASSEAACKAGETMHAAQALGFQNAMVVSLVLVLIALINAWIYSRKQKRAR